ncbi:hypothetical protein [Pseudomonas panipatensis]|uniref:Uncharacterized protein n=1 Tax=Pseudomonas panipatensis TaxID=428992 RepID=A0A1G8LAD9_9PSED|nr:hypothetical protein [Pseudomonas panipatensis]SDI52593.1 hypothetical protein SAMN05216272_11145 [Pseudomonas panipatensis]SMP75313.1 hypothetical protein SAMN06295951_113155 [Pseudomonas panipatensis]
MNKSGKSVSNDATAPLKGQSHPQGIRNQAPRLSKAESYSNPKTRADAVLQQPEAAAAPHLAKKSKTPAAAPRHAARGDDDLMSQEQEKS